MNSFVKTLVYGFAAIGVLLLSALGVLFLMLLKDDQLNASALRSLVLSAEERDNLAAIKAQKDEPPEKKHNSGGSGNMTQEELIDHIADVANASHATQLVSKLKSQQKALDERQAFMDQQWSDLQLAKAGLERMQRQLEDQDRTLSEQVRIQEQERARWAAAQSDEVNRTIVMGDVEKARYRDQARLFEQMKDSAWQSLKRFPPREIARYLHEMIDKKAARLLVLAQQDPEMPDIAIAIHQEMLRMDPTQATGSQVERLAILYSFMPATQVLAYIKASTPAEVAELLKAMATRGQAKKRAEILEALRAEDSKREMEVRRLLDQATPNPADAKI